MLGVGSIAMKSIRTTILFSLHKEIGPWGPLFLKFLLFILGNYFKNQNDAEFDFGIGHALALFPFLWIISKKFKVDHVTLPCNPWNWYIYILVLKHYFHQILW